MVLTYPDAPNVWIDSIGQHKPATKIKRRRGTYMHDIFPPTSNSTTAPAAVWIMYLHDFSEQWPHSRGKWLGR